MNTTARQSSDETEHCPMSQPARQSNIDALVRFFESGIKPHGSHGKLGIELEQIVVRNDNSPVSYSEEHGVAWLLSQLAKNYPEKTVDSEGDLLGVARRGEAITIEPAAQVELSAGPFDTLEHASKVFSAYENTLQNLLAQNGMRIVAQGYHPSATARSLELIPKQRYDFMNRYLSAKDSYGPCMMRGSASTQISIDYTSVDDCLRKMRLAYALVPLLSLICDNSPMFEGKPRTHKLMRTDVWRHTDRDRCGLVPGALNKDFTLERYAQFVLDTPAIVMPQDGGWAYSEKTFGEIYANQTMTNQEIEHAVSMQFPDVRLKTYLEIRPADSMPIPYVIAYAALIKGLFYSENSLDALDTLFEGVTAESFETAKDELMQHGYDAVVYGKPAAELCDSILGIALKALSAEDAAYLEPLMQLVQNRTTLADIAES